MKTPNFKTLGFALLCTLGFTSLQAQETKMDANYNQGFRLGFGVSPGYVLDDPYGFALGADARLQYDLSQRYSITLTSGYTHLFTPEDNGYNPDDLGFIPVKAGFKAFFWEDQFYGQAEGGVAIPVTGDYDSSPLVAPSIGWANENFDISLRYEHYFDFPAYNNNGIKDGTGQFALRIAYGFKL